MWRLIGLQGIYSGRFFDLDKDSITIGKGDGCGVSLAEDQAVADNQGELLLCNGSYVFRDLDGACPTTINGTVSAGMVTLHHGDMVQIGDSVFRIEHVRANAEGSEQCATISTHGPAVSGESGTIGCAPARNGSPATAYGNGSRNKVFVAAVAVLVLLAGIGVIANRNVQARRTEQKRVSMAEQERRENQGKMATEAILSLKAIDSALTVGITESEYNNKVIEAQTRIDAYVSECGEAEFDGLADKLRSVLQPYADAGRIWNYQITAGEWGRVILSDNPLYAMCKDRYPQVIKRDYEGGAVEQYLDPDADDFAHAKSMNRIVCDSAKQILWAEAGKRTELLRLPEKVD